MSGSETIETSSVNKSTTSSTLAHIYSVSRERNKMLKINSNKNKNETNNRKGKRETAVMVNIICAYIECCCYSVKKVLDKMMLPCSEQ